MKRDIVGLREIRLGNIDFKSKCDSYSGKEFG